MDQSGNPADDEFSEKDAPCLIVEDSQEMLTSGEAASSYQTLITHKLTALREQPVSPELALLSTPGRSAQQKISTDVLDGAQRPDPAPSESCSLELNTMPHIPHLKDKQTSVVKDAFEQPATEVVKPSSVEEASYASSTKKSLRPTQVYRMAERTVHMLLHGGLRLEPSEHAPSTGNVSGVVELTMAGDDAERVDESCTQEDMFECSQILESEAKPLSPCYTPVDSLKVLHLSGHQPLASESLSTECSEDMVAPSPNAYSSTPIIIPSSPTAHDSQDSSLDMEEPMDVLVATPPHCKSDEPMEMQSPTCTTPLPAEIPKCIPNVQATAAQADNEIQPSVPLSPKPASQPVQGVLKNPEEAQIQREVQTQHVTQAQQTSHAHLATHEADTQHYAQQLQTQKNTQEAQTHNMPQSQQVTQDAQMLKVSQDVQLSQELQEAPQDEQAQPLHTESPEEGLTHLKSQTKQASQQPQTHPITQEAQEHHKSQEVQTHQEKTQEQENTKIHQSHNVTQAAHIQEKPSSPVAICIPPSEPEFSHDIFIPTPADGINPSASNVPKPVDTPLETEPITTVRSVSDVNLDTSKGGDASFHLQLFSEEHTELDHLASLQQFISKQESQNLQTSQIPSDKLDTDTKHVSQSDVVEDKNNQPEATTDPLNKSEMPLKHGQGDPSKLASDTKEIQIESGPSVNLHLCSTAKEDTSEDQDSEPNEETQIDEEMEVALDFTGDNSSLLEKNTDSQLQVMESKVSEPQMSCPPNKSKDALGKHDIDKETKIIAIVPALEPSHSDCVSLETSNVKIDQPEQNKNSQSELKKGSEAVEAMQVEKVMDTNTSLSSQPKFKCLEVSDEATVKNQDPRSPLEVEVDGSSGDCEDDTGADVALHLSLSESQAESQITDSSVIVDNSVSNLSGKSIQNGNSTAPVDPQTRSLILNESGTSEKCSLMIIDNETQNTEALVLEKHAAESQHFQSETITAQPKGSAQDVCSQSKAVNKDAEEMQISQNKPRLEESEGGFQGRAVEAEVRNVLEHETSQQQAAGATKLSSSEDDGDNSVVEETNKANLSCSSSNEVQFHFTLPKEGEVIRLQANITPPLIRQMRLAPRHSTPIGGSEPPRAPSAASDVVAGDDSKRNLSQEGAQPSPSSQRSQGARGDLTSQGGVPESPLTPQIQGNQEDVSFPEMQRIQQEEKQSVREEEKTREQIKGKAHEKTCLEPAQIITSTPIDNEEQPHFSLKKPEIQMEEFVEDESRPPTVQSAARKGGEDGTVIETTNNATSSSLNKIQGSEEASEQEILKICEGTEKPQVETSDSHAQDPVTLIAPSVLRPTEGQSPLPRSCQNEPIRQKEQTTEPNPLDEQEEMEVDSSAARNEAVDPGLGKVEWEKNAADNVHVGEKAASGVGLEEEAGMTEHAALFAQTSSCTSGLSETAGQTKETQTESRVGFNVGVERGLGLTKLRNIAVQTREDGESTSHGTEGEADTVSLHSQEEDSLPLPAPAPGRLVHRHVRTIREVKITRVITDVYYVNGKEVERRVTEEAEAPIVERQEYEQSTTSPSRTVSSLTSGDLADVSSLSTKVSNGTGSLQRTGSSTSGGGHSSVSLNRSGSGGTLADPPSASLQRSGSDGSGGHSSGGLHKPCAAAAAAVGGHKSTDKGHHTSKKDMEMEKDVSTNIRGSGRAVFEDNRGKQSSKSTLLKVQAGRGCEEVWGEGARVGYSRQTHSMPRTTRGKGRGRGHRAPRKRYAWQGQRSVAPIMFLEPDTEWEEIAGDGDAGDEDDADPIEPEPTAEWTLVADRGPQAKNLKRATECSTIPAAARGSSDGDMQSDGGVIPGPEWLTADSGGPCTSRAALAAAGPFRRSSLQRSASPLMHLQAEQDVPVVTVAGEGSNSGSSSLVGLRVVAKWSSNEYFYSGRVVGEREAGRCRVRFDDGYECDVAGRDVLLCDPIPLHTQVTALSHDEYFSAGYIKGHRREEDELYYCVEKDGQRKWYRRVAVILSSEQGDQLRAQYSLDPLCPPTPHKRMADVSLDNLVEGKRQRRLGTAAEGRSPTTQAARQPQSPRVVPSTGKRRLQLTDQGSSDVGSPAKRGRKTTSAKHSSSGGSSPCKSIGGHSPTHSLTEERPVPQACPSSELFCGYSFVLTVSTPADRVYCRPPRFSTDESSGTEEEQAAVPYDYAAIEAQIRAAGGTVLQNLNPTLCTELSLCFLVCDFPCHSREYLLALAAGIPCVSHMWVRDTCLLNTQHDYRKYMLPSGYSLTAGSIIEWHGQKNLFEDTRVLLVSEDHESFLDLWSEILMAAKAATVTCHKPTPNYDVAVAKYDLLVSDASCPPGMLHCAAALEMPVVSSEWLVQCLVTGHRVPFTSHPAFRHDHRPV
ncbi:TP53-binding protein 1 isoform X2 [Petromyzon marinus]|uniref:TP53-binding protein 1 isoform X2 n=1 Tax=Petromyzon marinus TaxID=7757 RepID=UPI003F6E6F5C